MNVVRYPESESALLEFKREVPKNEQIIKTIIGFQMKEGNTGAGTRAIPYFVARSILLRGQAGNITTYAGSWEYKTQPEILNFLGCSLSPLMPTLYQQIESGDVEDTA